jgi:hypothetical protein
MVITQISKKVILLRYSGSKEIKMPSPKETYALTVKCKLCNFQVTQQVKVEPDNLTKAKTDMLKQAAAIHKQHSDPNNFVVF